MCVARDLGSIAQLVDEHIAANPLATSALSNSAVHYVVTRLILLHLVAKSSRLASSYEESSRFAACLLVLFTEEHLVNHRQTILGFETSLVYATFVENARRIDPSDLVVAVAAVDTTGLTSSMVDQPEFVHRLYSKSEDAIVFTHDQNSGALLDDAVKAFETARPDVVYIPETAKLDPSSWSDSEVAPEQLALYDKLTKHLSLRTQGIITLLAGLVMSYAVTWTVLSPQQPTSRVFLPRDGTLGKQLSSARSDQSLAMGTDFLSLQLNNFLQCGVLLTLLTAFAVLFPENPDSAAARRCCLPIIVASCIGDLSAVLFHLELYAETRPPLSSTNASWEERARLCIHLFLLCFVVLFSVVGQFVVFLFYKNSWRNLRLAMAFDGIVWSTAVLLLCALGEERYPPGDVPFAAAWGRPSAVLIGSACFTPSVRAMIARFGVQSGINHVSLSLEDLQLKEFQLLMSAHGAEPSASGNTMASSSAHGGVDNDSCQGGPASSEIIPGPAQ